MAVYPTSKVHRVSRRRLGRGQYPPIAPLALALTAAAETITFTSTVPLVVSGIVPVTLSVGGPVLSQSITSPYVFTQTYTTSVAAATYSLAPNAPNVRTAQGGVTVGESGTF
jgi:hypothetical protein